MTSLRVVDFSFAYEADQPNILNKINLDLTPGSFNLMVGPSGSGKSTLLKAMAGLLPKFGGVVTNGDVLLEGQSIGPIAPFEKAKLCCHAAGCYGSSAAKGFKLYIPDDLVFVNIQINTHDVAALCHLQFAGYPSG